MARRRDSYFNPQVYQDYNSLQKIVVNTLAYMISKTKGSMITFNAKKIAVNAGLPTHPVLLTLIKDVLEQLRAHGFISRFSRSSHGVKYAITKESAFWRLSKEGVEMDSLDAILVIARNYAKQ